MSGRILYALEKIWRHFQDCFKIIGEKSSCIYFLTISGPDYNYFIILLLYCIDASVINVVIEVHFDLSSEKN